MEAQHPAFAGLLYFTGDFLSSLVVILPQCGDRKHTRVKRKFHLKKLHNIYWPHVRRVIAKTLLLDDETDTLYLYIFVAGFLADSVLHNAALGWFHIASNIHSKSLWNYSWNEQAFNISVQTISHTPMWPNKGPNKHYETQPTCLNKGRRSGQCITQWTDNINACCIRGARVDNDVSITGISFNEHPAEY